MQTNYKSRYKREGERLEGRVQKFELNCEMLKKIITCIIFAITKGQKDFRTSDVQDVYQGGDDMANIISSKVEKIFR